MAARPNGFILAMAHGRGRSAPGRVGSQDGRVAKKNDPRDTESAPNSDAGRGLLGQPGPGAAAQVHRSSRRRRNSVKPSPESSNDGPELGCGIRRDSAGRNTSPIQTRSVGRRKTAKARQPRKSRRHLAKGEPKIEHNRRREQAFRVLSPPTLNGFDRQRTAGRETTTG